MGLVECYMGIFGSDFAGKITSTLEAFGLDLSNLRGQAAQAYDGAGNMAGLVNGTAALVAVDYHLAPSCCKVIANYKCL